MQMLYCIDYHLIKRYLPFLCPCVKVENKVKVYPKTAFSYLST